MQYELRDLDRPRLDMIRNKWSRDAGADEFAVEMGVAFDWAESHLTPSPGNSQALELCEVQADDTKAIVEVIDSREKTLTKILTLYAAPAYWSPDTDKAKDEVAKLYRVALTAMLARGMQPSTMTTIKIYGRTDGALAVLRSVVDAWHEVRSDWKAGMEGRWLALRRHKKGDNDD